MANNFQSQIELRSVDFRILGNKLAFILSITSNSQGFFTKGVISEKVLKTHLQLPSESGVSQDLWALIQMYK